MGLFDNFKKKLLTHQQKVNIAYDVFEPEAVEILFPGKQTQASNIIISIAGICGLNLNLCSSRTYNNMLLTYLTVKNLRLLTKSSDERIVELLQRKRGEIAKNEEIARKIMVFVDLNMKNDKFVLNSKENFILFNVEYDYSLRFKQMMNENKDAEKDNLDDPEYGLVISKPIYTNGVDGSYEYIESLKASSGEILTWKRLGSTSSPGIKGIIDIYESTLPSGEVYKKLYVNMYASKNSTKIPLGFEKINNLGCF